MDYYEFYTSPRNTVASPSFHVMTSEPVTTRRYSISSNNVLQRDLGFDYGEPMFDEPVVYRSHVPLISHHAPVLSAGHVPRSRVISSPVRSRPIVHQNMVPHVTYRSASLPPPSARPHRSRAADIETEMYLADYDVDTDSVLKRPSVRAYTPSPVMVRRRMPSLEPYKPVAVDHHMVTNNYPMSKPPVPRRAPATGGQNYGPPPRTSSRPRMSDTRRRIRDVICATRHDPHYYD